MPPKKRETRSKAIESKPVDSRQQTEEAVKKEENEVAEQLADDSTMTSATPSATGTPPKSPSPSTKTTFLTPEELDRAKDLVLDLLGWGVHPEYLIDCGVSSHAIYRIFTDLRLRLPTNLVL